MFFLPLSQYYNLALKAEFAAQIVKIHEQRREREEELVGGWYTEERMQSDLGYSKTLIQRLCFSMYVFYPFLFLFFDLRKGPSVY